MKREPFDETVHAVRRAIARIDRDAREVIVLRDIEGIRGNEVAAHLGISLSALKSRLHRARLALREEITRQGRL
jgi:RNA polymerase sigma-70 factor (ECF subfamily)